MPRFFLLVLFLFSSNAFSDRLNSLNEILPKGTEVSYLVVSPTDQNVVVSSQSEKLRIPASIEKLLTATAAKLFLGDNFLFKTQIKGNLTRLKDGRYNGDLTMKFVGDPTLKRKDLRGMFRDLKKLGVKIISGNLILDQSKFNGYQWSNGQSWNDLGVCYTSPSNAIIVNRNCVLGHLNVPSKNAKKATLYIPSYEPIVITSDVDIVTKEEKKGQFCDLDITRNSKNNYHLWGCVVPRKRAFGLAFSVNDPAFYATQIITNELNDLGIKLTGKIIIEKKINIRRGDSIFVEHRSASLDHLLFMMMKKSDNLIADSLFKTLGSEYFQTSGNFKNGALAVKNILKDYANIELENTYLADGSGLSRHNLISAEKFMSVLNYVYQNDEKLNLLGTFPIAGIDGTLKYHKGVRGDLLKGKIFAKTGSMKGVTNLLGIIKTPLGDRLFILMLSGYNVENDKLPLKKLSKFKFIRSFFENIILMKS